MSREYRIWSHMKSRCYNKKVPCYHNYGGRGIKVCDRWLESYDNFLCDMGISPSNIHSLDRFPDNNGNYEKSNCRWATPKEQGRNKRNNSFIELHGEKFTKSELYERFKIPQWKFKYYFTTRGKSIEEMEFMFNNKLFKPTNLKKVKIVEIKTGKETIFEGINEASRMIKVPRATISDHLRGGRKRNFKGRYNDYLYEYV